MSRAARSMDSISGGLLRHSRLSRRRQSVLIGRALLSAAAVVSFAGIASAADATALTEQPPIVVTPVRPSIPAPYGDLAAKMQAARQVAPLPSLQPALIPTSLPSPVPTATSGLLPAEKYQGRLCSLQFHLLQRPRPRSKAKASGLFPA